MTKFKPKARRTRPWKSIPSVDIRRKEAGAQKRGRQSGGLATEGANDVEGAGRPQADQGGVF
jgi:hypothetical protein